MVEYQVAKARIQQGTHSEAHVRWRSKHVCNENPITKSRWNVYKEAVNLISFMRMKVL
ncbi:hypothetical protein G9A89_021105 [Geosiphon pyriformis]|nr:hypothetical protein G9A89_021105 [Geosiphon pyriformis]